MKDTTTLENWKPSEKSNKLVKSAWRTKANDNNYHQSPGLDEVRKIKFHLKQKKHDHEIMEAFGIDATVLLAIKSDRYSPTNGIKHDNLSKIYKGFDSIERRLDNVYQALNLLADNAFDNNQNQKRILFKSLIKLTKKKSLEAEEDEDEFDEDEDLE